MINISSDKLTISSKESYKASLTEVLNFIDWDLEFYTKEDGTCIIVRKDNICVRIDNDFTISEVDYLHSSIDLDYVDRDDHSKKAYRYQHLFSDSKFSKDHIGYNILKDISKKIYYNRYYHNLANEDKYTDLVFELEDKSCLVINLNVHYFKDENNRRHTTCYYFSYENIERYTQIKESNLNSPFSLITKDIDEEIEFSSIEKILEEIETY